MKYLILLVGCLMILPVVSAVALSQDYHDLNPVRVSPGESKDIVFGRFQNNADVDKILEVTLVDDAGIATLVGDGLDSLVISAGNMDVPLNMKISISADAVENTEYTVLVNYKDISDSDASGTVTFTDSKTVSVPVIAGAPLVIDNETPEGEDAGTLLWVLVIGGLVLIGIIIFLLIRMNKKSNVVEGEEVVVKK